MIGQLLEALLSDLVTAVALFALAAFALSCLLAVVGGVAFAGWVVVENLRRPRRRFFAEAAAPVGVIEFPCGAPREVEAVLRERAAEQLRRQGGAA